MSNRTSNNLQQALKKTVASIDIQTKRNSLCSDVLRVTFRLSLSPAPVNALTENV